MTSLAKTDIDNVAELHVQEALHHLRVLAEKLYRRNPREWRKGGHVSLEQAMARLFEGGFQRELPELQGRRGTAAVHLAFRDDYGGDRVLAFIWGLATMTLAAYNDRTEYYALDELDPQKLYNAARNYEIAAWKLANARDARGELFLLSNEMGGEGRNLSFEREFGKLIGETDMMARIVAGRTQRTIVRVIQNLATAVFLPI
ncbi:hypothetical protein [Thiobacter aerophilum]|uniref:Lipoprotein n=1 Tax=Thiobacter aerophilum TaxID=3121275 RepID=A0ABV0ECZ3_9BURK